jgi:hypothetical protein
VIPSILAASRAAFSPLPIPTAATGTPGGICTTDSKESRFPGELLEAQGMPMTGLRVWESEGVRMEPYWLPEYLESQTRVSTIPWNPIEKN